MDNQLKELLHKLGNAINESLSESERINDTIEEIKNAGYDIFLILEATIAFNKVEDDKTVTPLVPFFKNGRLNITPSDEDFMRRMKISREDK